MAKQLPLPHWETVQGNRSISKSAAVEQILCPRHDAQVRALR